MTKLKLHLWRDSTVCGKCSLRNQCAICKQRTFLDKQLIWNSNPTYTGTFE